ncbi:MAG: molybdate ABC transporter substrate-binding protein [Opitutales bacterium]
MRSQPYAPAGFALALAVTLFAAGCGEAEPDPEDTLRIAAAASLQRPLTRLIEVFETQHPGTEIEPSLGASGALRRQIAQGAPFDLFLSAAPVEIERLAGSGRLLPEVTADFLGNTLVLAAGDRRSPAVCSWQALAEDSWSGRLAIGDVETAPVGRYAREVLGNLGLWKALSGRLIFGKNALQVARYLESGEVAVGIVYRSDLHERGLPVIAEAPPGSHTPIRYRLAVLIDKAGAPPHPRAEGFSRFLRSPAAATVFREYGFEPLVAAP